MDPTQVKSVENCWPEFHGKSNRDDHRRRDATVVVGVIVPYLQRSGPRRGKRSAEA